MEHGNGTCNGFNTIFWYVYVCLFVYHHNQEPNLLLIISESGCWKLQTDDVIEIKH